MTYQLFINLTGKETVLDNWAKYTGTDKKI